MKLVKASYEILTQLDGDAILKSIELAARTCYKSEHKISNDSSSAKYLVQKLLNRGHGAMLEFGESITVKFICDRGVSHELVRHRLASFAQESTRYCNYGKDEHISFIIPEWFSSDYIENMKPMEVLWWNHMQISEINYNEMIMRGWSPQQARSILPNSLKTEINVKANIREWRRIFKERTSNAAHPQMRELMIPLLNEFRSKIPLLFDDIKY